MLKYRNGKPVGPDIVAWVQAKSNQGSHDPVAMDCDRRLILPSAGAVQRRFPQGLGRRSTEMPRRSGAREQEGVADVTPAVPRGLFFESLRPGSCLRLAGNRTAKICKPRSSNCGGRPIRKPTSSRCRPTWSWLPDRVWTRTSRSKPLAISSTASRISGPKPPKRIPPGQAGDRSAAEGKGRSAAGRHGGCRHDQRVETNLALNDRYGS